MKGKFITFEGCEGAGKSTQIRLLKSTLDSLGIDYIVTREPGGSQIAEKIRNIILDGKNTEMSDECEALLYAAARMQHLKDIVCPALEQGKLVICDRYVHSSLAYQGYARGLGEEFVASINMPALTEYIPDLTLFLNINPVDAFARKNGADEGDRIEQMGIEFHEKVYNGYLALLEKRPEMYAVDCSGTRFETAQNIIDALKQKGII